MATRKDYYAVLGVSCTETDLGIHGAYRRLAKKCHPDRAGDQGTQKFLEIQEAYETLSDPEKSRHYDRTIIRAWQRRQPAPEPLVQSRPARVREPEPLTPRVRCEVEEFTSATTPQCPVCRGRSIGVRAFCGFCSSTVAVEATIGRVIAHYLQMLRREGL